MDVQRVFLDTTLSQAKPDIYDEMDNGIFFHASKTIFDSSVEKCRPSSPPQKQRKQRIYNGDPAAQRLSREERRRRRRCTEKYRNAHATRERARIEAFNHGFAELRKMLHIYPPDKKLSKIEILRSAITYIAFLTHILES